MNTNRPSNVLRAALPTTLGLAALAFTLATPARAADASADMALAQQVRAALAATADEDLHNLEVSASGGLVRLSGWVQEPREALQAQRVAQAVPGVSRVDERIHSWSATDYQ